jgi:undecaprenyl pyrophosphate synthase
MGYEHALHQSRHWHLFKFPSALVVHLEQCTKRRPNEARHVGTSCTDRGKSRHFRYISRLRGERNDPRVDGVRAGMPSWDRYTGFHWRPLCNQLFKRKLRNVRRWTVYQMSERNVERHSIECSSVYQLFGGNVQHHAWSDQYYHLYRLSGWNTQRRVWSIRY